MKLLLRSLLINVQFFTTIPIRKELPMDDKHLRRAITLFPLLGLIIGCIYTGILFLVVNYLPISHIMVALVMWLSMIVLTGAIHLDGWMDMNDAFFSYREQQKRLEIMSDPRVGAFGVISAIVILITKFILIYEVVTELTFYSNVAILFIPFLTRMLAGIMLVKISPIKKTGLGAMFHNSTKQSTVIFYIAFIFLVATILLFINSILFFIFLVMLLVIFLLFFIIRKLVLISFGGMTGDIVGAAIEGTEVCLWGIVWLLPFFVMG